MSIVLSEDGFWKSLITGGTPTPLILADGASCLYFLVEDVSEDLGDFIATGKTQLTSFHVFEEEREREMISHWEKLGLHVTYRSQQIEYMHRNRIAIVYLHVRDQENDMGISLLPWFLLPGRPYPVFVYIYSIRHYQTSAKKSLSRSAAATAKVFGIDGFNKSTLSRNLKALESFVGVTRIDRPLATIGQDAPSNGADTVGAVLVDRIPEILRSRPSIKTLEKEYGEMAKRLPEPINRAEAARRALGNMPGKSIDVIKESAPIAAKPRDARRRPAQPRTQKRVQRKLKFVGSHEIERVRKESIEKCRHIVMDAAVSYHRFLI